MPKNLILFGSSGTGKTLLLAECVKMKVAYYETKGKPLKIIIASYVDAEMLFQDLKEKYNLNYLMKKHVIQFKTVDELSHGKLQTYSCFSFKIYFVLIIQPAFAIGGVGLEEDQRRRRRRNRALSNLHKC